MLDEIYSVLSRVRADPSPPRAHDLLTELRDISSMAMEHFDEKIVPGLRKKMTPLQLGVSSMNTPTPTITTGTHMRM